MSELDIPQYEAFRVPEVGELKRTVGPIVGALADVVSPVEDGLPDKGYKERLGIDFGAVDPRDDIEGGTERADTLKRRLGVHAAVYLAGALFGCPGLDRYSFGTDQGGIISLELDNALDEMDDLEGVGGMEWDEGGRFAQLLSKYGSDTRWMIAAAMITLVGSELRSNACAASKNDVLEEVHFVCSRFTREYLSQVYGDIGIDLTSDVGR